MVSATLGGLIDNVIVGRFLGTEALGAMGIVSPVMFLFMALGVLCASGGAILVSQALGLKVINGITDSFEHRSGVGLNITLMTLHRE